MVAHLLAVTLPFAISWPALTNWSYFSWHPICMAFGYLLMMAEAMMIFSASSSLAPQGTSRMTKADKHGKLLLFTMLVISCGFGVIYARKMEFGKEHFQSWHAFIGLISYGYTLMQVMAGVALKYNRYFLKYLPKGFPLSKWKQLHGASGCLCYILACFAIGLGLNTDFFLTSVHEYFYGICMVAIIMSAAVGVTHLAEVMKIPLGSRRAAPVQMSGTAQNKRNKRAIFDCGCCNDDNKSGDICN